MSANQHTPQGRQGNFAAKTRFSLLFLFSLFLLFFLGGCVTSRSQQEEAASSQPAASVALPGQWLIADHQEGTCTYRLVPARFPVTRASLAANDTLALPCDQVNDLAVVGDTALIHGPCPEENAGDGTCWQAVPLTGGREAQPVPLQSPVFLSGESVLYPCGNADAFVQWCRWEPHQHAPSAPYPRIQPPPETDPRRLMPRAWGPPWLLMAEENACETGGGGKVVAADGKYWLINLTTGLPSPWQVWQAVGAEPRCLHEGESLEGYAQIDIIGWNPARPDELAFAVRRFPAADYDRPLEAYPFRTEIYVWRTNGDFVKVAAFSRLACGLWAPDGSGWLCTRLGESGQPDTVLFITRAGALAAQTALPEGVFVLQWMR